MLERSTANSDGNRPSAQNLQDQYSTMRAEKHTASPAESGARMTQTISVGHGAKFMVAAPRVKFKGAIA